MGAILLRNIMEKHFYEIQANFKRASAKNGYVFDYDIFIETYEKCNTILANKEMTKEQILQYFWVAYLNNIKKDQIKQSKITKVDIEEAEEIIDEPYDNRRLLVHDAIVKYVEANFTKDEFKAWYLHLTENKTYEELKEMGYTNINFHNTFRNITNHIKNKLPKENKQYKNIVKEIFKTK